MDAKQVMVYFQSLRDDIDSVAAKLKDHMQSAHSAPKPPKKKKRKVVVDEDDDE